ncbi:hypothetical protein [Pseudoroseicyclus sp. CXY001]|uniref:hypothetical protein n=1 Tax=Pseudoroseicyclus sp. CXY001 TaxID=3242492 RepID=UPI003571408A
MTSSYLSGSAAPLLGAGLLALAGCSAAPLEPLDVTGIAQAGAIVAGLDERLEEARPLRADDLPTSGTAEMEGLAIIGDPALDDAPAAVGGLAMRLDFAAERLEGEAAHFIDVDNREVEGELSFLATSIRDDGFTAQMPTHAEGTLTRQGNVLDIDTWLPVSLFEDADGEILVLGQRGFDGPSLYTGEEARLSVGIFAGE